MDCTTRVIEVQVEVGQRSSPLATTLCEAHVLHLAWCAGAQGRVEGAASNRRDLLRCAGESMPGIWAK